MQLKRQMTNKQTNKQTNKKTRIGRLRNLNTRTKKNHHEKIFKKLFVLENLLLRFALTSRTIVALYSRQQNYSSN